MYIYNRLTLEVSLIQDGVKNQMTLENTKIAQTFPPDIELYFCLVLAKHNPPHIL